MLAPESETVSPVLRVRGVRNVEEAITFVSDGPDRRPAMGSPAQAAPRPRSYGVPSPETVGINKVVRQGTTPHLPFDGAADSGMGTYDGRWGFDTFSHRKAGLVGSTRVDLPLGHSPYTQAKSASPTGFCNRAC
ncbi:hypothetical protein AB0D12_37485 [Streptomyces sp. NPDC048479]|uniref:hypothetical protein n=1 Tax=Streptomyces sp. NPDC048479 TaxID=3154725 RepID=UPI00344AD84C